MHPLSLLRGAGIVVALATIVGTTVEHVLRVRDDRQSVATGRLVRVSGARVHGAHARDARMHLDCRGSGSPTVVFEAGLDHLGTLSWSKVQSEIAQHTRACAYSRAGMLWSDAASGAFDARDAADALHQTLRAAGESAPWLLVGHSIGGPYAMVFATRYLPEVAGMVLVDPSHPAQIARLEAATGRSMRVPVGAMRVLSSLSWSGFLRLMPTGADSTWTPEAIRVGDAYYTRSFGAVVREARAIDATFAQAAMLRSLGDRPLVVLSAGKVSDSTTLAQQGLTPAQGRRKQDAWLALHRDLLTLSRDARQQVVPDATHYIQFDRADVVVEVVNAMVWRLQLAGTGPL